MNTNWNFCILLCGRVWSIVNGQFASLVNFVLIEDSQFTCVAKFTIHFVPSIVNHLRLSICEGCKSQ